MKTEKYPPTKADLHRYTQSVLSEGRRRPRRRYYQRSMPPAGVFRVLRFIGRR